MIARFALNGKFLSIDRSTLPCQLLRNVRFGVNFSKRCKITAAELFNAQVELLSPYLAFRDDNKSFIHALPVIVKSPDQVRVIFNDNYNNEKIYILIYFLAL